ncbi:hypothetical protein H0Z60_08225 [Ectothiorhodospiraceae bacterium WFHF3C12]|nr:hypothetical protein [Ectothiorhodospiraceae bacterium WFHF3C12]
MQGTVKLLNADDAVAAVQTEAGDFTIIGLMSEDAVTVGDRVSGALDADGAASLRNETRDADLEVYVEACGVSEAFARQQVD